MSLTTKKKKRSYISWIVDTHLVKKGIWIIVPTISVKFTAGPCNYTSGKNFITQYIRSVNSTCEWFIDCDIYRLQKGNKKSFYKWKLINEIFEYSVFL